MLSSPIAMKNFWQFQSSLKKSTYARCLINFISWRNRPCSLLVPLVWRGCPLCLSFPSSLLYCINTRPLSPFSCLLCVFLSWFLSLWRNKFFSCFLGKRTREATFFWDSAYPKMSSFFLINSLARYRILNWKSFAFRMLKRCLYFSSTCPWCGDVQSWFHISFFLSENKQNLLFARSALEGHSNVSRYGTRYSHCAGH